MPDELQFALDQIEHSDRLIRSISLAAFSDLPRAQLPIFQAVWTNIAADRRLELVAAMVEAAEKDIHLNFHTVLRQCLADPIAGVRRLAIEGLWEDNRISLVTPLARFLKEDPSVEVRAAAANSLGRFVLMGALGEVSETCALEAENALHEAWFRPLEETEVRRRALEGLAYSDLPHVHELIDNAYYDEDGLMRQSAIFAMGCTADRRWGRFVLDELRSRDAAMRFEAAVAAGELELSAAVRPLIHLLDDADSNVREAAATALGKIGGPEAKRALEAAIDSEDELLADVAEKALEELTFNSGNMDDILMEIDAPGIRAEDNDIFQFEDDQDYYDPDLDEYGKALLEEDTDPFEDLDALDWDDDSDPDLQ